MERRKMRILGIDPGYAIMGWCVLDMKGNTFKPVDYGSITTMEIGRASCRERV